MSAHPFDVYQRLSTAFGPQHWWPADSPLEVMIGAVLTQNTSWKNVERAIDNLRESSLLSIPALRKLHPEELAEQIRPAGYYRIKAGRLRNLLDFVHERYDDSLSEMFAASVDTLREELLGVRGIGPETADAILLYAGELPTFVVDNYTARILKRHGWIEPEADYHAIQRYYVDQLEEDSALFNEYHALLVELGKRHCGKQPKCEGCPLEDLLPAGGPQQPEW